MPKRGGARGRTWRSDDHYEHDDRGHDNPRRVIFKTGTDKKKFGKFINKAALRNELLVDSDISMVSNGLMDRLHIRSVGFRGRGARLNSPAPRHMGQTQRFHPGSVPWYQVVVPYGSNHSKEVIINALYSQIEDQFQPLCYQIKNNAAVFFIDDVKIAEKIYNSDRKILLPDGYRMIVKVRSQMPIVEVNDTLKEKMKTVMGKRYNPATKALDLTKFHADPDFTDVVCALFRPMVMMAVMNIIADNIADLEALNLNDNKLMSFENTKSVLHKFKNLKILYLANNKIPYVSSLMPLRVLPLEELNLKGNPLVSKFNEHHAYVSNVRKRFSKLVKLDEEDLPAMIGFDVSEDTHLPARQQSFLIDPAAMDIVRVFLTQYYAIYDSESRQPLLDAYHENAIMTVSATCNPVDNYKISSEKLMHYIQGGRNLIRLSDPATRRRHMYKGRLQVVSFISTLPRTQHDLLGSSVDLTIYTPAMMVLTLNGVFKELCTEFTPDPIRSYHRTLIIVPQGSGYCIQNDILYVSNPTKLQLEYAFKSTEAAPAPAAPAPLESSLPDNAQKMQLAAALSQFSGMNQHWATECLSSSSWDYQRAVQVFTQMHTEGKIPPEAFIK